MDRPKVSPLLVIWLGVLAVSASAIFVKLADAESGTIAFYRMFFSVVLMLPFFLKNNVGELKHLIRRDWIFSIIAGVLLAFHFILWFESLRYTSIASSTVLVTLQPLFAIVGTYFFFKERLSAKGIFAMLIALAGSIIISWGDFKIGGMAFYGDMLALIACAFVTGYMLFGQEVRKRVGLTTYTMIVYSVSAVTLAIYMLVKGESFTTDNPMNWLWFALLAIVPNLLGHTLFNWAIKYVSTNTTSIMILFEPIGASILAYWVFNESLVASQYIGGAAVILGILLYVMDGKKFLKLFQKND